jgi:hypothetical protein
MAIGVKALKKYREDFKVLSARQAIKAFCADCMGGYDDGPQDCENPRCPLYPYHPYNKNKVKKVKKLDINIS